MGCPAFEMFYGGTKGGGKSDFIVMAMIDQIIAAHEKWKLTGVRSEGRAVIFRRNLDNLTALISRTKSLYPLIDREMGIRGWGKVERRWEFSSGYIIDLDHLGDPDSHEGYQGQPITALLFDEAPEYLREEVYEYLFMQVRSSDPAMKPHLMVRLTGNPGGRHAAWIKKRFVEGCKPWNTIISENVTLKDGRNMTVTKAFVPARLSDNPHLHADGLYEANLLRLPPHMQQMYLGGNWDVVVGAHFSHVWDASIHAIKSFPIPGSWPIKGGLDWGATAPASTHWGTKDPDGNIYIIDELYCPGVTGRTYGEKMLEKVERQKWSAERKWKPSEFYYLTDRQARSGMGGDGEYARPAAGIASWGHRLFDMNKDRAAGIEQTIDRLLRKADGKPSLMIFKDRCPNLVRTLPELQSDPHDPEDVDTKGEDHAWDSCRAILMDWPMDNTRKKPKTGDPDIERWLRMAAERKRRAEGADADSMGTGYGD